MKRALYFAVFILLVVGCALSLTEFLNQNSEPLRLKFFYWQTKALSVAAYIVISFLLGLGLTMSVLVSVMFRKHFEARRLRRENSALQKLLSDKEKQLSLKAADSDV